MVLAVPGAWQIKKNINSKCTKNYPYSYQPETLYSEDGYPKYRRRNTGVQLVKGTNSYTN